MFKQHIPVAKSWKWMPSNYLDSVVPTLRPRDLVKCNNLFCQKLQINYLHQYRILVNLVDEDRLLEDNKPLPMSHVWLPDPSTRTDVYQQTSQILKVI